MAYNWDSEKRFTLAPRFSRYNVGAQFITNDGDESAEDAMACQENRDLVIGREDAPLP